LADAAGLVASTVSRLETGFVAPPKPDRMQRGVRGGARDKTVTATRNLSASRRQKSSAAHYVSLRLADGFAERVREVLAATLADEEHSVRLVKEHLTKRLAELEAKEHNLLDLLADGGAVAAKVRTRLLAISEQRERVNSELAEQGPLLEAGATLIETALDLLDAPQELYRQTTDPVRRQLNEVFFDRLYLDADDVVDDRLAEPFSDFLYPRSVNRRRVAHTRGARVGTQDGVTWDRRWGDKCRCLPAPTHRAWRGFE
jgi:hypothetical protein